MNTFVTSDHHFGHENILKYCNRSFSDIQAHDVALIKNWNSVVGKEDVVYHLGDFSLRKASFVMEIFAQLKGHIYLLFYPYHHDGNWGLKIADTDNFTLTGSIIVIENPIIVMCHYPFEIWDRKHYGALHFHGHSHSMLDKVDNRLDVGIDNAYKLLGSYRPFSLDEAVEFAKKNG